MRLIDVDALLIHSNRVVEYDEAGFSMEYNAVPTEEIKNAPTVEAVQVVRGEWKEETTCFFFIYRCSKCNASTWLEKTNFCPNCGADMRKKVDE